MSYSQESAPFNRFLLHVDRDCYLDWYHLRVFCLVSCYHLRLPDPLPSPRTILQQVFREEAERAVPSDSRKSKISEKVATISGRSKVFQRVWAVRSPLKANEAIEG